MKKRMFLTSLVVLAVCISANIAFAGNVEKAREFMKAGMYPQAVAILEKEIYGDQQTKANPTNAEAHFQLGACYVNQLNFSMADDRFASAVQLKPEYGYKISKIYRNAGNFYIDKGQAKEAEALFRKAIEYQPGLREIITEEMFAQGKALIQDNNFSQADDRFVIVSSLDAPAINLSVDTNTGTTTGTVRKAYTEKIGEIYFNLGSLTSGKQSFDFYDKARKYCSSYSQIIGRRLLDIARAKAKIPGAEKETDIYRKEAIKHLGVTKVNSELPECKVYPSGTYYFSLKAGEQTNHWITFPVGKGRYDINSKNSMFKVLYDDGDISPGWTPGNFPKKTDFKFKIIAVTDQPEIEMVIKWE